MRSLPPSARRLRETIAPGRRANPSARASWQLQRRHAEGGEWWTVEASGKRELLLDWVLGPPKRLDYGDLVRLRNPEGYVRAFWVMGREGLVEAGEVPDSLGTGWDWEAAWESPSAEAQDFFWAARGTDRRRLALAACAVIEGALVVLLNDDDEYELRESLAAVARAQREPVPAEAIERAVERAGWAAGRYSRWAQEADDDDAEQASERELVAFAARDIVRFAAGREDEALAEAVCVAEAVRVGASRTPTVAGEPSPSELVRRWIPLPVVLLGRAGEPTPLHLGF